MAIARTLTKKAPEPKGRSRKGSVSKLQISAPVELVSTTNMISYTSPNLRTYQQTHGIGGGSPGGSIKSPLSRSSTSSGSESSPESERVPSGQFFLPNMNEDQIMMSPKSPHRNGFVFTGPGSPILPHSVQPIPPIPPIPQMSSSRSSTSSMSRTKSTSSTRSSHSSHHKRSQPSYSSANPFAAELHKVSEIAESFGILGGLDQEEEEYMRRRGLRRFKVDDYIEALGLVPEAEAYEADEGMGGWI